MTWNIRVVLGEEEVRYSIDDNMKLTCTSEHPSIDLGEKQRLIRVMLETVLFLKNNNATSFEIGKEEETDLARATNEDVK